MKITVRDYSTSDYEACRSLWGELAQHHADIYGDAAIAGDDPGRGFDEYLGRADRCGAWVAEIDDRVKGLAGLLTTREMDEGEEIEPVVVAAPFRNRGIGTKLVRHVVTEARRRGVRYLRIRPVMRNEGALRLHARLGFNLVGHIDLVQDLSSETGREWKPGLVIHDQELRY